MWRGRKRRPGLDRRARADDQAWWVVDHAGLSWCAGVDAGSPIPTPRTSRLALDLASLLESLGPTASAVARSLESCGVRATRGLPPDPVVAYLMVVVGAEPSVARLVVHEDAVVVGATTVPLPLPVRHFRRAFDAGCFPTLEGGVAPTGRT